MTIINSVTGGGTGNIAAVEADSIIVYPGTTVADRPIEASSYGLDGMSKVIVRGLSGLNWRTHPITGSKYLTYPRGYGIPGGGFDSSWEYNWRNAAAEMSAADMTESSYNSYGTNVATNRAYTDKLPIEDVMYSKSYRFTSNYSYSDVEQPIGDIEESTLVFNSWFTSRADALYYQTRDICTVWKMPADRDMGNITTNQYVFGDAGSYWSGSNSDGISHKVELKLPVTDLETPEGRGTFNEMLFTDDFHSNSFVCRGVYMNLYDPSDVFIGCVSDRINKYTDAERFNAWRRGFNAIHYDSANSQLLIQCLVPDISIPREINGKTVSKVQCIMDLQVMYCANFITYMEELS